MERAVLRQLRWRLDRFLEEFRDCYPGAPGRANARTYIRGQLGPLPRKSIEPIALDAGVLPRTLQEFFAVGRWDDELAARRVRELVRRDHADPNGVAIFDESGHPKKGKKTAGVRRQWCGATGKIENCVVTVHLVYAAKGFHAILDSELFLPESWSEDRARCREAGIPDEVVYRPKWRIALEELDRALGEGMAFRWATADELYGRVSEFRAHVGRVGIGYVVEVPTSLTGWIGGRRAAGRERPASSLTDLHRRHRADGRWYNVKETRKGPVVWRAWAGPFQGAADGSPEGERAIFADEALTGEKKVFLTNAPAEVPLTDLLSVGFSRWHVERTFEDGKGEIGLDHFEVRKYKPLKRHLVLSAMSFYFLSEQTERLRGEKSGVDAVPGACGGGGAIGPAGVAAGAGAAVG